MTDKNKNTINLFAVDEIIKIGKMFEGVNPTLKLGSLFIKETDLKFVKKDLDFHGSDINENNNVVAFCSIDIDTKFHRLWYKLVSYKTDKFESWKLIKEDIEYK